MKCYVHTNTDAVGLCSVCARGLCADCVTEARRKLTCRGQCEERAHLLLKVEDAHVEFIEKTRQALSINRKMYYGVAAFLCLTGVILVVDGRSRAESLTLFLGYVIAAFGILSFVTARRMPAGEENSNDGQQKSP